jgi:group I intron endonuclease
MTGRKHSEESKTIMSEAKKGKNHPMFDKNHSDETRKKISEALKGQSRPAGAGKSLQAIEVFDLQEKTTTSYNSFSEAARALNFPSHKTISYYILNNQVKPYKGRFTFKVVEK